jgi:hypothetical protein
MFLHQGSVLSNSIFFLGYCICQTTSSLCALCFNVNDNQSTGRVQSVLLLALSVILSLVFQYALAPWILQQRSNLLSKHNPFLKYVMTIWSCDDENQDCPVANSGVYRICACTTLFFVLATVASKIRPSSNREAWSAKYSAYLLLLLASALLLPNHPWLDAIYLPLVRLGSAIFIVLQQLILIDLAYRWNDSWLNKEWYSAIITCCLTFFTSSLILIVAIYNFFANCSVENKVFIFLTLVLIIVSTIVQLFSQEANLLTSSIISLHVTYLLYSAISKNPLNYSNGSSSSSLCHPPSAHLHVHNIWSISAGMFLTFLSLVWTGWAFTSRNSCTSSPEDVDMELSDDGLHAPFLTRPTEEDTVSTRRSHPILGNMWKLNASLILVSCWVCVTLTGWGSNTPEDPMGSSKENMYIILASQWVAVLLYIWTLIAPSLFPDRDFS